MRDLSTWGFPTLFPCSPRFPDLGRFSHPPPPRPLFCCAHLFKCVGPFQPPSSLFGMSVVGKGHFPRLPCVSRRFSIGPVVSFHGIGEGSCFGIGGRTALAVPPTETHKSLRRLPHRQHPNCCPPGHTARGRDPTPPHALPILPFLEPCLVLRVDMCTWDV